MQKTCVTYTKDTHICNEYAQHMQRIHLTYIREHKWILTCLILWISFRKYLKTFLIIDEQSIKEVFDYQ